MPRKIPSPKTNPAGWHRWRKAGITGTGAAILCNVHPKHTIMDLYDWQKHDIPMPMDADEGFLEWCLSLETPILKRYKNLTGRRVQRIGPKEWKKDRVFRCTPDGRIIGHKDGTGTLEIKSMTPRGFSRLEKFGADEFFMVQANHNAMVQGHKWASIAPADRLWGKVTSVDFQFDPELAGIVLERGRWFRRCLKAGRRPTPKSLPDPIRIPRQGGMITICVAPEWMEAVGLKRETRANLEEARALDEAANFKLKQIMAHIDADAVEGGGLRAYHRRQVGKWALDERALLRDHPEVDLDAYRERGESFKTFRTFEVKKEW